MNDQTGWDSDSEAKTDMSLPKGCLGCEGELLIRLTPAGATSFCPHCRLIGRPEVDLSERGLKVTYRAAAA